MGVRRLWDHFREHPVGGGLVAIPFVLIVTITVLDVYTGRHVQLGPLLVIAPALTASLAGPRLTALAGVLAVAAQVLIAVLLGGLTTSNRTAQIIALTVLSALVVLMRFARERRDRALSLARSVAETAQRALLRPPPRRIGPLQVAWLYMSPQDEAEIGGDLFAFARAAHAATRVVIGDVRGNGLAAIGEASLVLGAFREGAHRYDALPGLVTALGDSVSRNLEDVADTEHDPGEHFITCLVLEIPDDALPDAEMINCGHPPPLLVHDQRVTVLHARQPLPPLGVRERPIEDDDRIDPFTLTCGDMLVLYTDGVIEARSPSGAFYPLAERVASFPATNPDTLLHHIHRDLLAHIGGHPADDAALLVIERTPSHRPHLTSRPTDGHHRHHPDGART
ncbi:PP2C family protein-serine/threonine phosphatase [Streptomyces atratus]|uniref:PP2C family protein-serine/threonine phosphatase n=1 Tax=Streptomyces atratus TaxID=1893 RepID=UPI002AC359DA|nr:PP2C family protein-serine/threonine phosphatase [Streptomyces atratus]WPW31100.1 PP2C family protein-serine/threonine phosphatase [Streptomyces atratus]